MRIVAVADTHLCHDGLSVPAGDVFVHAGDLCRSVDARGRERHLAELASAVESTWEGERGASVFDLDPVTRACAPVHVPPSGRY